MFDIGWTELLVIAIVLIVVVGPKDLPPMLRAFGKMTANLRKMAGEFRTQFDEALREADLDDVRKTIGDAQRLNPTNALREAINPLRQMGQDIRSDLRKATQLSSAGEATKADAEAQQAVEGASSVSALSEVPVQSSTASAAPVAPVSSAPLVASTPTSESSAPASAELPPPKPKRVRKAPSAAPAADGQAAAEAAARPKRPRSATKPAVPVAIAADSSAERAAPTKPRRRVAKKNDAPKDDA